MYGGERLVCGGQPGKITVCATLAQVMFSGEIPCGPNSEASQTINQVLCKNEANFRKISINKSAEILDKRNTSLILTIGIN